MLPATRDATVLSEGKVVFISDRTGTEQLFVKDLDSGALTQLTPSGWTWKKGTPAISPNGQFVAFTIRDYQPEPSHMDYLLILGVDGSLKGFMPSTGIGTGYEYLSRLRWAPDSSKLLATVFNTWAERGLATIHVDADGRITQDEMTLMPSSDPDAIQPLVGVFSPNGHTVLVNADAPGVPGGLYEMELGAPGRSFINPIYGNNEAIRRAYAITLSPDSQTLLANSELYRDDPAQYLDEEIVEVGYYSGVIKQITREPGNEYPRYAWGGEGEYVMHHAPPGEKNQIFVVNDGVKQEVDVQDSQHQHQDWSPTWAK